MLKGQPQGAHCTERMFMNTIVHVFLEVHFAIIHIYIFTGILVFFCIFVYILCLFGCVCLCVLSGHVQDCKVD